MLVLLHQISAIDGLSRLAALLLMLDGLAHIAFLINQLGIPVDRGVRVLIIRQVHLLASVGVVCFFLV